MAAPPLVTYVIFMHHRVVIGIAVAALQQLGALVYLVLLFKDNLVVQFKLVKH